MMVTRVNPPGLAAPSGFSHAVVAEGSRVVFLAGQTGMDATGAIPVRYQGLLPDLFREGQGVVTEGVLEASGTFRADTVLAKHDETYMPREVADALKRQGHWQGGRKSPQLAKS